MGDIAELNEATTELVRSLKTSYPPGTFHQWFRSYP